MKNRRKTMRKQKQKKRTMKRKSRRLRKNIRGGVEVNNSNEGNEKKGITRITANIRSIFTSEAKKEKERRMEERRMEEMRMEKWRMEKEAKRIKKEKDDEDEIKKRKENVKFRYNVEDIVRYKCYTKIYDNDNPGRIYKITEQIISKIGTPEYRIKLQPGEKNKYYKDIENYPIKKKEYYKKYPVVETYDINPEKLDDYDEVITKLITKPTSNYRPRPPVYPFLDDENTIAKEHELTLVTDENLVTDEKKLTEI